MIENLLAQDKTILFRVADDDYDGFEDAFDLGFKPTGTRTMMMELLRTSGEENDERREDG